MAVIDITIKDRIVSVPADAKLVCNNPTDIIRFNFDAEWESHYVKTARFAWNGTHIDVTFSGNEVQVPEIYRTHYVEVGVFTDDLTSISARIPCIKSIKCVAGKPETPNPDVYNELLELINNGVRTVEPAEDDIPMVFIEGTIPTTKDDVFAELTYISKSETFHAFIKIKCQGSSSMSYPKKNFTIKLYSDEARVTKMSKVFKDWGIESDKFVLKANYIDHSHARNIICARLWDEVVSSRSDYESLPVEMRNSPRNGAVDGFPIKVYTNGTYQGVYTWNIGKDAWMWGMDEDNPNHLLLCNEENSNGEDVNTPSNFRALWDDSTSWYWSVEIGTKTDTVVQSLNALISCVKDTDDETFKATIGNYLDVQSAIDYWIHQYVICGLDGLGKNLLLATYDGKKWICGAYDMDSTFGLHYGGGYFVSPEFKCPEEYQEHRSLLWERISSLFADEVAARYAQLRNTVYSYSNLFTEFERFMDIIGLDLYAEDLTIYPSIPSGSTNNIQQIRQYAKDRLYYCDEKFGLIGEDKIILVENLTTSEDLIPIEVYAGAIDWDTQSCVFEMAQAENVVFGDVPTCLFVGAQNWSVENRIALSYGSWVNDASKADFQLYAQTNDYNGGWAQVSAYATGLISADRSNFKLEINKDGIFVNEQNIAARANNADVYDHILTKILSSDLLFIDKKTTDATGVLTFKSIYLCPYVPKTA